MKRNLVFERFYPHPVTRVWKALTDSDAISTWFEENDFQPVVGHKFQFRTSATGPGYDGILYCEVLEVEAPYRLVYSFYGGMIRHQTQVIWTLVEEGQGTRLRLEHTGFTGLTELALSGIVGFGWRNALKQLAKLLNNPE